MKLNSSADIVKQTICIVPMYNEAEVVSDVVRGLKEIFPNVLCIDDGSSDDSADLAAQAGATVIRHAVNIGQGAALATGFEWAAVRSQFEYVITFDADGQHRPSDALALVAKLKQDSLDVVFASRFLGHRSEDVPLIKQILLRSVASFTRFLTNVQLTDAHNGLRALTLDASKKIVITQNGMAHATQFVSLVLQSGLKYSEIQVKVLYTPYSRSKGQSILNSVNIVLDLIWR
jgi:glycosyltransferase involved in cell wall biosynthesis